MPTSDPLQAALDRLEEAFRTRMPGEVARLTPPLSEDRLEELSELPGGYRLPADLQALYRWHDGFDSSYEGRYLTLLMDASFPSLEVAIAERDWLISFWTDEGDPSQWPACWFPAFGDGQHGEFVTLEPRSSPQSPLLWSYHSHDGELTPQYDSVTSMIDTTAQLWEQALLPWTNDDDPGLHRRRLELVAELNPQCFDDQTSWTHRRYSSSRFLDETWLPEWTRAIGYEEPTGELPDPVPIGLLDLAPLDGVVPIAGRMSGLAGGLGWQHVEVTDSSGTVTVRISQAETENYVAANVGDSHMFWITAIPSSPVDAGDPADEVTVVAERLGRRIAADFVAVEIRPLSGPA